MEREIKFRGKRKDGSEWVYGLYTKLSNAFHYILVDLRPKVYRESWVPVELEPVGQFTGLYDKNGNEIYEGDILECLSHYEMNVPERPVKSIVMPVVFYAGRFVCEDEAHKTEYRIDEFETVEVIGNIHDNPELITQ